MLCSFPRPQQLWTWRWRSRPLQNRNQMAGQLLLVTAHLNRVSHRTYLMLSNQVSRM